MYAFAVLGMKYFAGTFKFALDGTVDLVNGYSYLRIINTKFVVDLLPELISTHCLKPLRLYSKS